MVYGAIDLHMRYSQIRSSTRTGTVLRDQRVLTTRERLVKAFDGRADADLLETGTESEWVAQALEAAGHEVIVADPNYAPMYGDLTRRSRPIARRGRVGRGESPRLVSRAHRTSARSGRCARSCARGGSWCDAQRPVSLLRALLRQEGYRLGSGSRDGARSRGRLAVPASSPPRWRRWPTIAT